MGNCEACLSRKPVRSFSYAEEQLECSSGEREEMVRVVRTTDNELFEFPAPVFVRDLLFGFPGFAVYPHPQYKPPSSSPHPPFKSRKPAQQRPIHPDTLLKLSHLYYLTPLVNPFLIINPDDTKGLGPKCSTKWVKPGFRKPFINAGLDHPSLNNTSDKDLLLDPQADDSSAESLIIGSAGDLLEWKVQEMLARDVNNQEKDGPATINAQEGSLKEHAPESLITIDARQPAHVFPEASLASNARDRTSNGLAAEGVFASSNAQEKPSSSGELPNDQRILSQTILKRRKVRFSDEVEVIPSSNYEFTDSASTSPTCSPRSDIPVKEAAHPRGDGGGQFDQQAGRYSISIQKEQHMGEKKELVNGVVRVKVVISKKQLAELMAARASGDEDNIALMEKMLTPFLSPASSCHKSEDSFHGGSCASPSWRPSLHRIPENPSPHELF